MGIIQVLALLFAVMTILKFLLFVFVSPKKLQKMVLPLLGQGKTLAWVALLVAAVLFWFVQRVLSVQAIVAGMFIGMLLFGMMLYFFEKTAKSLVKEMLADKQRLLLLFVPWLIIAVWVLVEVFA